jgi:oligopeptide/dipeptide ABC transporter ATP-binding protein
MEAVLNIRNLCVNFPKLAGTTKVLRGCSLDVASGEIVGLVGESGSGKSMTAMSCLGLVPEPGVTNGNITIDGKEVVGISEEQQKQLRGSTVGMIFQNPMTALNPFISIGDQFVDAIQSAAPVSRTIASETSMEVLKSVYISNPAETLKKYPHQLSGGQLQRIMIAMVIACNPRLLIADEPTTALDVTIQAQVLLLIREITTRKGFAVLFITHDLSVVATICDRVAVMYAGEIVEFGNVTNVFNQPAHPYTKKLLNTVPVLGTRNKQLDFIPGQVPDMAHLPAGCAFQTRCESVMDQCRSDSPAMSSVSSTHTASCHLIQNEDGLRV